jgi:hypothetical protein
MVLRTAPATKLTPSFLTFPLETREFVYGIRLKLSCSSTSSYPALIRVRWGSNDDSGEKNTEGQLKSTWETEVEPQAKKLTVWVNEPIKQFTVSLDAKSCSIWISEVALLVSQGDGNISPRH